MQTSSRPPERIASLLPSATALDRLRPDLVITQALCEVCAVGPGEVRRAIPALRSPRGVAFLEWTDPPICGGHWNPELVELAGGTDGLGEPGRPSRTVEWKEILAWRPEVMVLACCGFDAERTRREALRLRERPGFSSLPLCADRKRLRARRRRALQPAGAQSGRQPRGAGGGPAG